jgi:IS5 family transposase
MQNSFSTQPALFITNADLEHASLRGLDDAEAVLDWAKLEHLMAGIYASKTGRPSYPLLTLLRASLLGIWYRLSDVELAQTLFRDLLFRKFCHLELGGRFRMPRRLDGFARRWSSTICGRPCWARSTASLRRSASS